MTSRTRRSDGGDNVAEYRSIGDTNYIRDPHQTEPFKAKPGRPWIEIDAGGVAQFGNGDVTKLLAEMERTGATVTRVGVGRVRGFAVTRYHITRVSHVPPKLRALGYNDSGSSSTELWADAQHRVRRVMNTSHFPTNRDRVNFATDMFDFGVDVTVHAPPANTITKATGFQGRPAGPWVLVGSGSAEATRWSVYRRPLVHGGACVTYTLDGSRTPTGVDTSSCSEQIDESDPVNMNLAVLPNGAQLFFGIVSPKVQNMTLHYDDGTTTDAKPRQGGFAFAFTGDRVVKKLTPHIPGGEWSCDLDVSAGFASYNCSGGSAGSGDPRPFPIGPPGPTAPPGA